jgi:carboxyl-terminal processing protease
MIRFLGIALCASSLLAQGYDRQANLDSFEYVWKAIRDKHWDPKPGGLDWPAVHDEFRPRAEKAQNIGEMRALLREMLGRLKQTHFNIFPSDVYQEMDHTMQGEGTPGIDIRVLDGQPVVTDLEPGSPAEKSGVHRGWVVSKVGGTPVAPMLQKIAAAQKDSNLGPLYQSRAVLARLSGRIGSKATVEFLDEANQPKELEVERIKPRGNLTRFGFLPPMYFWFETRKVSGSAYIRFNMFMDLPRLAPAFEDAVKSCIRCDGMMIDLRGNPGGIGGMAMGLAGWFIDEKDKRLGTMFMRDTTIKFIVIPRAQTFKGPLAILVDGSTGSTSEIFTGGMKDLGRARVFGTRTAGAALPSVIDRLPNGDGFQYATANYISDGGKPLEGLGVTPNVEVKLTRKALLEGHDPVIDAALDWIKTRKEPQ